MNGSGRSCGPYAARDPPRGAWHGDRRDCRFLSAQSYRQRCLIDVLVSALLSIWVELAFTDWGVLAYVLTGLVFAALLLASAITNRRRPATAADRRCQGGAIALFHDDARGKPQAGRPLWPGETERSWSPTARWSIWTRRPAATPSPGLLRLRVPFAQRWRETGAICWIPARRITLDAIHT